MHQVSQNRASLHRQGFGILEIVIASAIIGGTLFAMISVFLLSKNTIEYSTQKLQASYLAEEGLEALRFLRDAGWTNNISPLISGTDYYISFSTSTSVWIIGTTPAANIEGLYARSFRIENVSRDASANIQSSYVPANDDPGTRKIIMKVDWAYKNNNQSVSAETYITDLFSN